MSGFVTILSKRFEHRHSAEVAYEFEQRKRIADKLGRYHGPLVSSAAELAVRLSNLEENHAKNWQKTNESFEGYYFRSCVYRFMKFFAVVRMIEKEALHLDARTARREDIDFLNFAQAFSWLMSDKDLFSGLKYDSSKQHDHFFADMLRLYSDRCIVKEDVLSFEDFFADEEFSAKYRGVLLFWDGISPDEPRYRWDRLMAFHLLLKTFLDSFGFPRHAMDHTEFSKIADHAQHKVVIENLCERVPMYDLSENPSCRKMLHWLGHKRPSLYSKLGFVAAEKPSLPS